MLQARAAVLAAGVAAILAGPAVAEEIGQVTTAIKILGANHRIVVEAFDDPKVEGVSCYRQPGAHRRHQGLARAGRGHLGRRRSTAARPGR